jgi:large subunit ribosomal protein L13
MRHTGYPGGQRTLTAKVLQSKPCTEKAVKGMLPKKKFGAELLEI